MTLASWFHASVKPVSDESPVVGHKTFRNKDGSFRHEPIRKDEADKLMAQIHAKDARREALMPDEQSAIQMMFDAWQRLKDMGWNDACYCPKDGSTFTVIEPGSTGQFPCFYKGEWPNGTYWIQDDMGLSPSHPVLFKRGLSADPTKGGK